jgi:hypothetical protein
MNRADEGALAWALANSVTRFLRPGARAWLCAKIGAGDQDRAIRDLLTFYANSKVELPDELAGPIRAWIRGYVGSDSETLLRRLYDQITVCQPQATGLIKPLRSTETGLLPNALIVRCGLDRPASHVQRDADTSYDRA